MQFLRSKHTQTIRKLDLLGSANFASDESCVLLAELLNNAPHINNCNIRDQTGERKVEVEIEYAKTEEQFDYEQGKNVNVLINTGTIKVVTGEYNEDDKIIEDTKQVITEVTTSKNKIQNEILLCTDF